MSKCSIVLFSRYGPPNYLPPIIPDDGICESVTWNTTGVTVAGAHGAGSELNELNSPLGLFVDNEGAVYVVDTWNDRIVKWTPGAYIGKVVAGGNGEGNANNQLNHDDHDQTIIVNIACLGLAMNHEGSLYISDGERHCIIKWPSNNVVAGENGEGSDMNKPLEPAHVFVDENQSVFVIDFQSAKVMQWPVGSKECILVAGGNGEDDVANQLNGIKYSTMM
ncbi:unnamed protein product [Rotaria socialis]|uniref:Uncharacterized protein n=1 Tax=Rotaria socialis TaxID=392032 RepID=A0A818G6H8_9BILA|nr:unnamed protein product [Rotaria socialis]